MNLLFHRNWYSFNRILTVLYTIFKPNDARRFHPDTSAEPAVPPHRQYTLIRTGRRKP